MNYLLRLTIFFASLALLTAGVPGGPRGARADEAKHEALRGKPARDFEADFAVNGKPVKLADLKGKVVLLAFWAPWSGPSRTVMPQLQAWSSENKIKGLEVVAVGRYDSDFGRHLIFDKQKSEVVKVKKATRATDKLLLRDFAADYKLDFLMMKLPKDEWNQVRMTYGVSGIPQFVVIDRKGVVRKILVGSESKNLDKVQDEIKTLLEERP